VSPLAHLVGSWLVAVATTTNSRDRKLVTWAGVLPDADGLGVFPDVAGLARTWKTAPTAPEYVHQYPARINELFSV